MRSSEVVELDDVLESDSDEDVDVDAEVLEKEPSTPASASADALDAFMLPAEDAIATTDWLDEASELEEEADAEPAAAPPSGVRLSSSMCASAGSRMRHPAVGSAVRPAAQIGVVSRATTALFATSASSERFFKVARLWHSYSSVLNR